MKWCSSEVWCSGAAVRYGAVVQHMVYGRSSRNNHRHTTTASPLQEQTSPIASLNISLRRRKNTELGTFVVDIEACSLVDSRREMGIA